MRLLTILAIFLNSFSGLSQSCNTYINTDQEIITIWGDSIAYRLKLQGALISCSYAIGSFKKKRKKIIIDYSYYPFAEMNSIQESKVDRETSIVLLNSDDSPMLFTPVQISID